MKPLYLRSSNQSIMDIQATKLELMQLLLNTQKERVLVRLKEVFEQEETSDFWDELHPNLQASIDRAITQSARGKGRPHRQVMDEIRTKYAK